MKRKDLAVGLEVEVQHGETYKRFDQAIVLASEPWTDRRFGKWSKHDYRRATSGSGVAVAVQRKSWVGEEGGQVVTWFPGVVQLQKLRPVGTAAAVREQEAEDRAKREATSRTREQREATLRGRVAALVDGVSEWDVRDHYVTYHGSSGVYGSGYYSSTVEIKREVLERLLELAEGGER